MAKSTVVNDIYHREDYKKVTMAEFLEFFARLAGLKFKEGPYRCDSLHEKVEHLMDIVFPIVGMIRKDVIIEEEYVSVSEEELDEDCYFV